MAVSGVVWSVPGVDQDDDIIRTKTVGKITGTTVQQTYDDGSFLQDADVAAIATAAWTDAVKEAWRLKLVADKETDLG